jgi:diguanylate cyclase
MGRSVTAPRRAALSRNRDNRVRRMSPARRQQSADHRVYLGDAIITEMRASRLPFEPRQFEFWFAYKSERNAALNASANAIKARNGVLTGRDIERLHERYLSPWRMAETPDAVAGRLGAKLQDLTDTLEGAIGSTQAQREIFAAETAGLSANTALTLQDVLSAIDRLTRSAKETQVRYALLEARMDAMGREISALQQQLSAVRAECQVDPTTARPNRATFDAILATALAHAAETRQPMSVVLCNLDYFAGFNENFGTYTGDQVLRSIAVLFKAQLRPVDVVARFGGDEYAAILPQMQARDAVACAERFRQTLMAHELIEHPNGAGRVTVSIGVSGAVKDDTPELLLGRAGNGLRVAKREGRNRVVEMSPDGPIWQPGRRA